MKFTQLQTLHKQTMPFYQFCKLIQRKSLLEESRNFLVLLNLSCKPQILLTVFLISKYSKFVLSNDKLDENLLLLCNQIIEKITNYCILLEKQEKQEQEKQEKIEKILIKLMLIFNNRFEKWKKKDLKSQLTYYAMSYCELNEIKKIVKHESYQTEINKIQQNLLTKIKQLDKNGEEFIKKCQLDYDKQRKIDKKIEQELLLKTLSHNMKKAFWTKFTNELQENPPNLQTIPSILQDINKAFLSLVHNNKQFRDNINEVIDYEFLSQLIEKNCFSYEHIFKLAFFMMNTLKQVGMSEKDTEINELLQWIKKTKKNSKEFKLHLFLPKLFQEVFNRIEEIQNRLLQIRKNL